MLPALFGLVNRLSFWSLEHASKFSNGTSTSTETISNKDFLRDSMANTAFYFATVLVTLTFTELGKASFATTRPQLLSNRNSTISSNGNSKEGTITSAQIKGWKRRYGELVSSLKSKHSFPSGDCAQAMNLCIFLSRYVPAIHYSIVVGVLPIALRDMFLFGIFLPGVAFARVFYGCHWIEDCIGGILLSLVLHLLLIPMVGVKVLDFFNHVHLK